MLIERISPWLIPGPMHATLKSKVPVGPDVVLKYHSKKFNVHFLTIKTKQKICARRFKHEVKTSRRRKKVHFKLRTFDVDLFCDVFLFTFTESKYPSNL